MLKNPCKWMLLLTVPLLTGCGSPASEPETAEPPAASETVTEAPDTDAGSTVTTLFQGGIGGEQNAGNPQPEYFVYRFMNDNVSARLAGGTYQVLHCDFSAIFQKERTDIPYYLEDYNGDGHYDLYTPVQFDGDDVTQYAVFIWKPDTQKFEETPVMLDNPKKEG